MSRYRRVNLMAKFEHENVHPSLIEKVKLDAESWSIGFRVKPITARTKSGSLYRIEGNGHIVQIKGNRGHPVGELNGAVYRVGGPIRVDKVVVGLCIEYIPPDEEHTCYTSRVIEIICEE